jgi:hypothetical protein
MNMNEQDERLLQQIQTAREDTTKLQSQLRRILAVKLAWIVALASVSVGVGLLAYRIPSDLKWSFWQSLCVEVSAGIATFVIVERILSLNPDKSRWVVAGGIVVSLVTGICAYHQQGVTQSFLIEACVGAMLVVGLDLLIMRFLSRLDEVQNKIDLGIIQAIRKASSAESELDDKYAWHDYLGLPRPDVYPGLNRPESTGE